MSENAGPDISSRVAATFLHVTRDIQALPDVREVARRASRAIARLLGADTAAYFTLDADHQHLTAVAGYRVPRELLEVAHRIASEDVPAALQDAIRRREPLASASVATDARLDGPAIRTLPLKPRGLLFAPATRAGSVRGALLLCWWTDAHEPMEDEMRVATAVATHVAMAIDASRAALANARTTAVLAPNRTLFIVARHNDHLFRSLSRTFAGDDTVQIVLDRRAGERRSAPAPDPPIESDGRRVERRNLDVERQIRRRGWAVVTVQPFPQ